MHLRAKIALSVICTVAVLSLLVYFRRFFPRPVERALEGLRNWWLPIAKKIGHGQTIVLLTIVYYTGIALTSLLAKCLGRDFLHLRGETMWYQRLQRKRGKDTLETLGRQF
jgi:hypothetical protein